MTDSNAKTTPFEAVTLSASITVRSVPASMDWYCNVIGFQVERKIEREGRLAAVSLRAGNAQILLNQDDGAKGLDREKGTGISLMFTTHQSIDEIADRIKQRGGKLENDPVDMPWGARMFRIADPDGFKYTLSSVFDVGQAR